MSSQLKSFFGGAIIACGLVLIPKADLIRFAYPVGLAAILCFATAYYKRAPCKECGTEAYFTIFRHCMKCNAIYCGKHSETQLMDYYPEIKKEDVVIPKRGYLTGPTGCTGPVGKCCKECKT